MGPSHKAAGGEGQGEGGHRDKHHLLQNLEHHEKDSDLWALLDATEIKYYTQLPHFFFYDILI